MKMFYLYILILIGISCKDVTELADKKIPDEIHNVINRNKADSFLVDSIGQFEWEELYILKPYLTESQYEVVTQKVDNMPWMGPSTFSGDQDIYFVFVNDGKAIKFSHVPRFPFDFIDVGKVQNPVLMKKGKFLYYQKDLEGRYTIRDYK